MFAFVMSDDAARWRQWEVHVQCFLYRPVLLESGSAGSTGHWTGTEHKPDAGCDCRPAILRNVWKLPPLHSAYKLPFPNSDEMYDDKAWEAQQDWLKATGAGCLVFTRLE